MAKFNDKISTILHNQLPEFVVAEHPKFAEFLKVYYQLLESAELKVTSILSTDGIKIESETGQTTNIILNSSRIDTSRTSLDAGDKIILEESTYGKFTRGETIIGQSSGATAVVLTEDLKNGRLIISSQDKFEENEIVVGNDSNAFATINNYRPNPVQNISELVNFRDPDKAIAHFLTQMRDEFLITLPETLNAGVDKRKLIKNIKTLYRRKGTVKGHEIFFRILFGENSETLYPREQLLKASDGQFDTLKVLRVISSVGSPAGYVGRTITGQTSRATAIVENTTTFQIGADEVAELILNLDSMQGTFDIGETIQGTKIDTDEYFIKAIITGIPGTKTITNDGTLNSTSDTISITGGGVGALFQIEEVGTGGITDIVIDNAGSGYEVGDPLVFTNTNTGGTNAVGFVSVVNGGFSGDAGTTDMGNGDRIIMEDETTRGDRYDGRVLMQDSGTGTNEITNFFLTSPGSGYSSLPTVDITTSTGTAGSVFAYGTDVGKITKLKTVELGKAYENAPTPPSLKFFNNCIVAEISGTFIPEGTITSSGGATAEIVTIDITRGVLKLKDVVGTIAVDETLTSNTSGTATVKKIDLSTASVSINSVVDTDGRFISERGKLSENTMRVQDSLYYQDFSYVLKVSRSIGDWRDAFKKTMHVAGFYFTGQVNLETRLDASAAGPVKGIVSGVTKVPFFGIINTLFSTIFGRRLGTVDDGTDQRLNPLESGTIDLDPLTHEHLGEKKRDVTLIRPGINFKLTSRKRVQIFDETGLATKVKRSHAYAGPRYGNLNKWANTVYGTHSTASGITFGELNKLRVFGTGTTLDEKGAIFLLTSNEHGQQMKMNFAIPTEVALSAELFSNTLVKFDTDQVTFDDTTP